MQRHRPPSKGALGSPSGPYWRTRTASPRTLTVRKGRVTHTLQHEGVQPMRSIHLRFSDNTYGLIQQEAEALEVSVAQFARVAVVARAALWAHRRGFAWADAEAWGHVIDAMDAIDEH